MLQPVPEFLGPLEKKLFLGSYRARVEGRADPARLYRLQVRIPEIHSKDTPSSLLPWAYPKRDLTFQSGELGVPPLGTWVWVEFNKGDHEYPMWSGSAWGEGQAPQGILGTVSAHRVWPTSAFGSDKECPKDSILAMEPGGKPENAPNNFGYISPLQKRLELDDRLGRQRILLADYNDNFLWLNSEVGVFTMEAITGVKGTLFGPNVNTLLPQGITVSADAARPGIQMYTFNNWLITIEDAGGKCEISAPSGAMFRITSTPQEHSIQAWSSDGHFFKMDDGTKTYRMESSRGFGIILDNHQSTLYTKDKSMYLSMNLTTKVAELFTSGDFICKAEGSIALNAGGDIALDARHHVLWQTRTANLTPTPNQTLQPVKPIKPNKLQKLPRACDYKAYEQPEKVG